MGRTYSVPRSVKGESRILFIFSIKSFMSTLVFGLIGVLIWLLLKSIGLGGIGIGFVVALAGFGYVIMTFSIPDSPIMGKYRKAGGEMLGDIIWRTVTFTKRKKIYVYREGGKKQWDKKQ